ncbi:7960_t:CDS:1, partial [Cetraspora pellucida]
SFRQSLHNTVKANLPLHINATKQNPTLGEHQTICKALHEDNSYKDTSEKNISSAPVIKNYYITAEH